MKKLSALILLFGLGSAPFILACDDDSAAEESAEDMGDEIEEATE